MTNRSPMLQYRPELTIDGETYTTAAPTQTHTALEDISVRWGTSERTQQADASILTAALWNRDPTKLWELSLIGRPVILRARRVDTGTLVTTFSGVVTDQSVSRRSAARGDGDTYGGLIVTLTCADVRTQLANTICSVATMPRESHPARVNRILAQFPDTFNQISGTNIPEYGATWGGVKWGDVDSIESGGRNLAELLDEAFASYYSTWTYWPTSKTIAWLPNRAMSPPNYFDLGELRGELVMSMSKTYSNGEAFEYPIPGRYTTMSGELTRSAANEVTAVEVSYKKPSSQTGPSTDAKVTRRSTQEAATYSASTATVSTIATTEFLSARAADYLIDMYDRLRAAWEYPDVVYRSDLAGGFVAAPGAEQMLRPYGSNEPVYITGSWYSKYEAAPVCFIPLGGVVEWFDGAWRITFKPSPIVSPMGFQVPVSWQGLAPANATVKAWNVVGRRIHDSVTWEDLRFISQRSV